MLTHIGTNTIETERLILRKFEYTDDEAMLKYWVADEKIQSLYSEPVYSTKEEVRGYLTSTLAHMIKVITTVGQLLRKNPASVSVR